MILVNKQYSTEFKMDAVKRLEKSGDTMSKVAADLGVKAKYNAGMGK